MPNLIITDAQGNQKSMKVVSGTGTDADPYVVAHADADALDALNVILSNIGSLNDPAADSTNLVDAYGNPIPHTLISLLKGILKK